MPILTRLPKKTVSIVECGWRKLNLGWFPSQVFPLRGVLEQNKEVTSEDCLHCWVRLMEVEPREVPESSLSTSLNKEVTSANSFKSCFLLPGPLGGDKLLSLLILSMNFWKWYFRNVIDLWPNPQPPTVGTQGFSECCVMIQLRQDYVAMWIKL